MNFKKIDLGDAAQTIATIGVIGGLGLLAFELRQNNELLEAQASFNLTQNRIVAQETWATDEALGLAMLKGIKGDELTELEQFKLERIYVATFTKFDWEFQQYQQGRISETQLPVSDWVFILETWPGMRDFWDIEKTHGRTPEFVEFMDEQVVGNPSITDPE